MTEYEDRYKALLAFISSDHPFVVSLELILLFVIVDFANINAARLSCTSRKQFIKSLRSVINEGGEGVILRKPHSLYEHGRSTSLLKFKVLLISFSLIYLMFL